MTNTKHVTCSICGDTLTDDTPTICQHCREIQAFTKEPPEKLRQRLANNRTLLATTNFRSLLRMGNLADNQYTALDDAFNEVLRQAKDAVLRCDNNT